jgi:hypothetical protein
LGGGGEMNLENEVPSLELCQEWKKIGGRKDTCFRWSLNVFDKWEISDIIKGRGEEVSAPMIGEMMEWLKEKKLRILWLGDNTWEVGEGKKYFYDKILSNALMQMCIYIEKENHGKT